MKIPCFRCGKGIDTPNNLNADYVIAEDTKVDELREVLIALKDTPKTKAKAVAREPILDSEYTAEEISSPSEAQDAVKIIATVKMKRIQKTGVICPDCYKPTDTVIWGVHKQ
jgi:hypothetical protein